MEMIKINNIKLEKTDSGKMKASIGLDKDFEEIPELTIKENILQVSLPNTYVWPSIHKSVSLNKNFDTKIMAYQYDKKTVRFRTILPYSLKGKASLVKIVVKKNKNQCRVSQNRSKGN